MTAAGRGEAAGGEGEQAAGGAERVHGRTPDPEGAQGEGAALHGTPLYEPPATADTSVQLHVLGLSCRQPNAPPLSDTGKIPPGCVCPFFSLSGIDVA